MMNRIRGIEALAIGAVSITGELPEATSKYGRKYGCRHRAHGREFRGTWSRNSSEQALGARYGRGRATKFPRSRPRKFRGAQIPPRNSRVFLTPVFTAVFRGRFWLFAR